jgi:uncharacterized protein (DUF1499 family)
LGYFHHQSRKAKWSWRIALASLLVFAAAFIWHRFFSGPTPTVMRLLGFSIVAAITSFVLAIVALVNIWNEGYSGAMRASAAVFLSLLVLAVPSWGVPKLLTLPRINDITTDVSNPPAYDRIASIRPAKANPIAYNPAFAPLQQAAYPDIKPMELQKPVADVFSLVREAVKALKWKVVDEQAPDDTKAGRIEATDRTRLFGFTDDIVIRVTGSAKSARVDIRSSSRFGRHDFGQNATRIRRFIAEVKERLNQLEQEEKLEQEVAAWQQLGEKADQRRPRRTERRQRRGTGEWRAGTFDHDSWPRWPN